MRWDGIYHTKLKGLDYASNSLTAWVCVAELDNSKSIFAYWGNPTLAHTPPDSSTDGSTWRAGYRGVWHLRPMSETDVLTDSTLYRNHATNVGGITAPTAKIDAGRLLQGVETNISKYHDLIHLIHLARTHSHIRCG